jgi:hypothetical protein
VAAAATPDADGSYFLKIKTYRLSHIQKRRREV